MQVAVYDTYVTDQNGKLMHFDVIVPADATLEQAIEFGHVYLKHKGCQVKTLTAQECRYCHTQQARPEFQDAINQDGYYILEMEGCRD